MICPLVLPECEFIFRNYSTSNICYINWVRRQIIAEMISPDQTLYKLKMRKNCEYILLNLGKRSRCRHTRIHPSVSGRALCQEISPRCRVCLYDAHLASYIRRPSAAERTLLQLIKVEGTRTDGRANPFIACALSPRAKYVIHVIPQSERADNVVLPAIV